jgi:hypothetical protein
MGPPGPPGTNGTAGETGPAGPAGTVLDNSTVTALQFIAENIEGLQNLLAENNNTDPTPPPQPPANATLSPELISQLTESNWADSFNTLYDNNVERQTILS